VPNIMKIRQCFLEL